MRPPLVASPRLLALVLLVAACRAEPPRAMTPPTPAGQTGLVSVILLTEQGEIELELDGARAPGSVQNFLAYLDAGDFKGGVFHRTVTPDNQPDSPVKIEVIQGSISPERTHALRPPIALERTSVTGLRHQDGTVSLARGSPDSAQSDFFICIGDQPALDFGGARNPDGQGFAAFGRVVRGMDVVRAIQHAPAQGQRLSPPIRILGASRKG